MIGELLLQALNRQGIAGLGMKPVAAGAEMIDGQLANDDALALAQAGCSEVPYSWVNPCLLPLPVAPHIAAERAGRLGAHRRGASQRGGVRCSAIWYCGWPRP